MDEMKIGRAGQGYKIHLVSSFTRPIDGLVIDTIICGAQQFNGSGNGGLNRLQPMDITKVTCKRCLKRYPERVG